MKLLTQEIKRRMPFRLAQDGLGMGAIVHLKLFNPYGSGTWLITEAWQVVYRNGDYVDLPLSEELQPGDVLEDIHMFGYCNIHCWEWGQVSLNELLSLRKFGRPQIEREIRESDGKHTVERLKR